MQPDNLLNDDVSHAVVGEVHEYTNLLLPLLKGTDLKVAL